MIKAIEIVEQGWDHLSDWSWRVSFEHSDHVVFSNTLYLWGGEQGIETRLSFSTAYFKSKEDAMLAYVKFA